jgi:hypothetical protein
MPKNVSPRIAQRLFEEIAKSEKRYDAAFMGIFSAEKLSGWGPDTL